MTWHNWTIEDLRDSNAAHRNELLSVFWQLCSQVFSDPNEMDDLQVWEDRLWGHGRDAPSPSPIFHCVLLGQNLHHAEEALVCGGVVAEYYRESECGLLSYALLRCGWEEQPEVGQELLETASRCLRRDALETGAALTMVFSETTNSDEVKKRWSQALDARPLESLYLRANWLDFEYVQPPLGLGKSHLVGRLTLLAHPELAYCGSWIAPEIILSFLCEYYRSYGIKYPDDDSHFARMREQLLLGREEKKSFFKFRKGAICLHFVQDYRSEVPHNRNEAMDSCDAYWSWEKDVLATNFRDPSVMFSRVCGSAARRVPVTIKFSGKERFICEGEERILKCGDEHRKRKALATVSYTDFPHSRIRVWHLVLSPDPDKAGWFTELDLIKLIKLYECIQEKTQIEIKVTRMGQDGNTREELVPQLIENLSGAKLAADVRPDAGTVTLDMGNCDSEMLPWYEILKDLGAAYQERGDAKDPLDERFRSDLGSRRALRALSGIAQGVFGFERIGPSELRDNLKPVVKLGTNLILILRGTLLHLDIGDDELDRCRDTMGMSPYMLLAHAAILHNEEVLKQAEEFLDDALACQPGTIPLPELENIRKSVEKKLSEDYLPNIFHYPTERLLMDEGLRQRSAPERIQRARHNHAELAQRIQDMRDARAKRSSDLVTLLIVLLTGLAVHQVFTDLWKDASKEDPNWLLVTKWQDYHWLALVLALIAVFVACRLIQSSLRDRLAPVGKAFGSILRWWLLSRRG